MGIDPLFRRAQRLAFDSWRGGPTFANNVDDPTHVQILEAAASDSCPNGAHAIRDWRTSSGNQGDTVEIVHVGGDVYGRQFPQTFGGPFTWAGQRYAERSVQIATLRNVLVSGNEGVITRACNVFVPYYDVQVPWHENLPSKDPPEFPLRRLRSALWLLVMFPANFFSFLVDELARLAAWLTVTRERVPLLVPADRGKLKGFMHDWFTLFGDFQVIPYDVRPHFMGASKVSEPRFAVDELHIVDWTDAPGTPRRGDVFLLPPRWALEHLRSLATKQTFAADSVPSESRTLLWIQRSTATTRRVANEPELLAAVENVLSMVPGSPWSIKYFSDVPPAPTARDALNLFHTADIVLGVHGSGQANVIFCRPGTGIIDVNMPEPHSQYTAHNSYALELRYRLVMMRGTALHQAINVTVPIDDVLVALRSLLTHLGG